MKLKKSTIISSLLAISLWLLSSCTFDKQTMNNSISSLSESTEVDYIIDSSNKNVAITFIQCPFSGFSYDDNGDVNGYYFKNEILLTTIIDYEKGHFLSQDEIDSFYNNKLNYRMPELHGDGYWRFTFFVTDFNEESGLASNYLKPQELNNDINVYFSIYG